MLEALWGRVRPYLVAAYAGAAAVLVGIAWYFFKKSNTLEKSNASLAAENQVAGVMARKEDAKKEADNAETDYTTKRDAYLKSTDGAGGDT